MNKQIEKLAQQAGYLPDSFGVGHWNSPEFQKYTELLLKKCAHIAWQNTPYSEELTKQADGGFIHKLITGAKQYTFLKKDLEKFAELIVLDCVNVVMDGTKEGDHYAMRIENHFDNGKGGVLHFGVEE